MARSKKTENRFHKNNANRPLAGNTHEYTTEQLAELIKCKKDILYFAENYFYIVTGEGRQKIVLFDKQKQILTSIVNNKLNAVLSSRQNSKTTLMTIYCLYRAIFNSDKLLAYAANKESTAKEILGRIKLAYDELPVWLKPGVGTWSEKSVSFANDTKILIGTTSVDSFRGLSIDTLFLDEFAFVPPEVASGFFNSVMPAISSFPKSKAIMVSTPNGAQGLFYEIYNKALKNENDPTDWKAIKMHWTDFPGRDEEYKRITLAILNGDENRFAQEFDCQFVEIGTSAFNGKMISELKDHLKRVQPLYYKYNQSFKVYKNFNRNRKYVAGIDVSGGVGADSHCIQILDITDLEKIEQVAIFNNNSMPVNVFAHTALQILLAWGSPLVLIENNNQGLAFINFLKYIFEYKNIVNFKKNTKNASIDYTTVEGIESNFFTKNAAIDNFKYFFEHLRGSIIFNEIDTIMELETFSKKESGYGANKRYHDDRVMALVWALFVLDKEVAEQYLTVVSWDANGKPKEIVNDMEVRSFENSIIMHDHHYLPILTDNSYSDQSANYYSGISFI